MDNNHPFIIMKGEILGKRECIQEGHNKQGGKNKKLDAKKREVRTKCKCSKLPLIKITKYHHDLTLITRAEDGSFFL